MMAAAPAVETKDLVKVFERGRRTIWQRLRRERDKRDRFRAVDGIDLVVEPGEIFGLLGPNGAGKTTTMKMLATLLIPTSGTIRVLGIDPLAAAARSARTARRDALRRTEPLLEAHRPREPRILRGAVPRAAGRDEGAHRERTGRREARRPRRRLRGAVLHRHAAASRAGAGALAQSSARGTRRADSRARPPGFARPARQ